VGVWNFSREDINMSRATNCKIDFKMKINLEQLYNKDIDFEIFFSSYFK